MREIQLRLAAKAWFKQASRRAASIFSEVFIGFVAENALTTCHPVELIASRNAMTLAGFLVTI